MPEAETFLHARFNSLDELNRAARALLESPVEPIVLDAHNLEGELALVTAFAGMREDVEYQVAIARPLGFAICAAPLYQMNFGSESTAAKTSVLPSQTIAAIQSIAPAQFLAHLGNGIIYFRGGTAPDDAPVPAKVMGRLKNAYDPKQILPAYCA